MLNTKIMMDLDNKLNNINTSSKKEVFKKEEKQVWKCRNCGYIYEGDEAPKICPVCAHPQSYFEIAAKNY